jgi:hypothetical protein
MKLFMFYILLVAPDAETAKAKALNRVQDWSQPHRDNLFEVDKAMDVTALMRRYGCFLKLTKAVDEQRFTFVCRYLPL